MRGLHFGRVLDVNDVAATDESWRVPGERRRHDPRSADLGAVVHQSQILDVVPVVLREVRADDLDALPETGRDHEVLAPQELRVLDAERIHIWIILVDEKQRLDYRAETALHNEEVVHVFHQRVLKPERGPSSRRHSLPKRIKLLRFAYINVVIPREGVEGPQLDPPRTELGSGSLVESADVRTVHRKTIHIVQNESGDREAQELPGRPVVTAPVPCELAAPGGCRSRDDERQALAAAVFQIVVGGLALQEPEVVVDIVLSKVSMVVCRHTYRPPLQPIPNNHKLPTAPFPLLKTRNPLRPLFIALPITEVRGLIHVQPDSRKVDLFLE